MLFFTAHSADDILSAQQAMSRALNYNNSMIQLNQKMNTTLLKYEDFYRKTFNFNLSLKSSAAREKDLTYSYYEYMYNTESTKSSLQDSDSLKTSIELEISKQFKYSTQALFYSNITTSSSLSTTDKDGDFSDTTLDQYSTYDTRSYLYNPEIGFTLTHYLLGKDPLKLKKSVKSEEHKVEQTELSNFLKIQDIIFDVLKAYYNYSLTQKVFELKLMSFSETQKMRDLTEKFLKLGQVSKYDFNKVEIELLQDTAEKEKAQADCRVAKEKLLSKIGMPLESDIKTSELSYSLFPLSIEQCADSIHLSMPEIELLDIQLDDAAREIESARKEYLPDIKLSGTIAIEGNDKDFSDCYKNLKNKWNIGFDLEYKLYDFSSKERNLEIARSKIIELEAKRRDTKDQYTIELSTIYSTLRQDENMLQTSVKKASLAKENMDYQKKRFYEGQAKIEEFIDAKKQYYASEISRYNALYKASVSRLMVEKLAGLNYFSTENLK